VVDEQAHQGRRPADSGHELRLEIDRGRGGVLELDRGTVPKNPSEELQE